MIKLFRLSGWLFLIAGPLSLFMTDAQFGGGMSRYGFFTTWCFTIVAFLILHLASLVENPMRRNIIGFIAIPIFLPVVGAGFVILVNSIFGVYDISSSPYVSHPFAGKFIMAMLYCLAGIVLIALYSLLPKEKYLTMKGLGRGDRRYMNREDFYALGKKIRDLSIKVLITAGVMVFLAFFLENILKKSG